MKQKIYAGLIVKVKDKVLLCKRNNQGSFPGMWSIPGGKVEPNEEISDACKREFFEETAIDISDKEPSFVGLVPRFTRDGQRIKGMMHVFLIESAKPLVPDLEIAKDGSEHTECGYFTKEKLEENKIGKNLYKLLVSIFD